MIWMDIFSMLFCFFCLAYACYSDIKSRSVTDNLWLLMIAVGIPLACYNILTDGVSALIHLCISILPTTALAYFLFWLDLFGGADAKSLVCISLLIPVHPEFELFSYRFPVSQFPAPFAISTIFDAAVISLFVPLFLFFYNLFSSPHLGYLRENFGYMFIGYKVRIDELTGLKHTRLIHLYEEKGGKLARRIVLSGVEISDEMARVLKKYADRGEIEGVWVTPELPFMLFITSGFIISIFYGNLICVLFSL